RGIMSSTNESTSSPTPAGMTVAQIAAVVLAVSVVSYLVWDAQSVADQEQLQPDRVVPADLPEGVDPCGERG
ncbi:MAG: hypothetical protein ACI9S9_003818, partial [Planctomycetota bacterium]